jgi:hypothetical protein
MSHSKFKKKCFRIKWYLEKKMKVGVKRHRLLLRRNCHINGCEPFSVRKKHNKRVEAGGVVEAVSLGGMDIFKLFEC